MHLLSTHRWERNREKRRRSAQRRSPKTLQVKSWSFAQHRLAAAIPSHEHFHVSASMTNSFPYHFQSQNTLLGIMFDPSRSVLSSTLALKEARRSFQELCVPWRKRDRCGPLFLRPRVPVGAPPCGARKRLKLDVSLVRKFSSELEETFHSHPLHVERSKKCHQREFTRQAFRSCDPCVLLLPRDGLGRSRGKGLCCNFCVSVSVGASVCARVCVFACVPPTVPVSAPVCASAGETVTLERLPSSSN